MFFALRINLTSLPTKSLRSRKFAREAKLSRLRNEQSSFNRRSTLSFPPPRLCSINCFLSLSLSSSLEIITNYPSTEKNARIPEGGRIGNQRKAVINALAAHGRWFATKTKRSESLRSFCSGREDWLEKPGRMPISERKSMN